MPPKRSKSIDALAFATSAYVAQAYEVAIDLDTVNEDDHEVLLDQIDHAGTHVAFVLWCLHPEWAHMDDRVLESKALGLFRRFRPEFDEQRRGSEQLLSLLNAALRSGSQAVDVARWHGPRREHRRIAAELAMACDHMENALYLLDPDAFRADCDATTPTEKVRLASRIEVMELQLEENRQLVRGRFPMPLN